MSPPNEKTRRLMASLHQPGLATPRSTALRRLGGLVDHVDHELDSIDARIAHIDRELRSTLERETAAPKDGGSLISRTTTTGKEVEVSLNVT